MLACPEGGIYCARSDCQTRNSHTKGHIKCTYLLCKGCCQKSAFNAQVAGNARSDCTEHRHQQKGKSIGISALALELLGTNTPSDTTQVNVPISQLLASSSTAPAQLPTNMVLPPSHSAFAEGIGSDFALALQMALPPSQMALPALQSTTAPSASGYAHPILTLWQKTPLKWVAKLRATADVKDEAAERKQINLETQAQAWQSIMAIVWKEVSLNGFI